MSKIGHPRLGKPSCKKNGQKSGQCPYGAGGGLPQFINFSLILPGPQITWKWTIHTDKLTTKCHICLQGGLMCGIWYWQSMIVKDLKDSQDPKHTLFCRENAFVAIYTLFSDTKCPLFLPFFLYDGFPKLSSKYFVPVILQKIMFLTKHF